MWEHTLTTCSVTIADNRNLLLVLFTTGLVGGLSHCLGMCGPFVLSQVEAKAMLVPACQMRQWQRITEGFLWPYHLGRATTYALIGVAGAFLFDQLPEFKFLRALLLLLAAALLLAYILPFNFGLRTSHPLPNLLKGISKNSKKVSVTPAKAWVQGPQTVGAEGSWMPDQVRHDGSCQVFRNALKNFLSQPTGLKGYVLGLLLGFIPCGLVYGALTAASIAGPLGAFFAMLAFAVGTMPILMLVGILGHIARQKFAEKFRIIAKPILAFNALLLLFMAWQSL